MTDLQTSYDIIGKTYSSTRRVEPRMLKQICDALKIDTMDREQNILDVGSGTANYTIAIAEKGYNLVGLEPSAIMIDQAKSNCRKHKIQNKIEFVQAFSNKIPYEDGHFSRLMSIFAVHHFQNLSNCIIEMARVVKSGGIVIIITADPRLKKEIWIDDYFDLLVESATQAYLPIQELIDLLEPHASGEVLVSKILLSRNWKDLFFLSCWDRPELFLEDKVRCGMSHFAKAMLIPEKKRMVQSAITKLKNDLEYGKWQERYGKSLSEISEYDGGYRILSFTKK